MQTQKTGENPEEKMVCEAAASAIRHMDRGDIDEVMDIERQSFASPWTKRMFEETLRWSLSGSYVFVKHRVILGYVMFYTVEEEGHILNVAVRKEFKRNGIAARLLSYVFEKLRQQGVSDIFLEVRESNVSARGLYDKFGFETVGRRRGYYAETNEDALVMRLTFVQNNTVAH